jgi:hypothetical protein
MVNFRAVCGCCTRTDIVKEHLDSGGHSKDLWRQCLKSSLHAFLYTIIASLMIITLTRPQSSLKVLEIKTKAKQSKLN